MMIEWNPCEGLKEIGFEDIRVGDVIRTYCKHGEFQSCVQHVVHDKQRTPTKLKFQTDSVKEVIHYINDNPSFYLVERPVVEPISRGDVVEIYLRDDSREVQVESYIRVRSKFMDEDLDDVDAWTSVRNNMAIPWEAIVNRSRENSNYRLRIFKALYEEVG